MMGFDDSGFKDLEKRIKIVKKYLECEVTLEEVSNGLLTAKTNNHGFKDTIEAYNPQFSSEKDLS
jgi:hypothetical protein